MNFGSQFGRKILRNLLSMALFIAIPLAASAWAAELKPPQTPFRADAQFSAGNTVQMDGPMWYDGGLERREMVMDTQDVILITRPDQGLVFMISPDNKAVMQLKLKPEMRYYSEETLASLDAEEVGREMISDEATIKYRVDGGSGGNTGVSGFLWVTEDGIAIKFEGMTGSTKVSMLLTNVVRGPVDPALFEVPTDFQIMELD